MSVNFEDKSKNKLLVVYLFLFLQDAEARRFVDEESNGKSSISAGSSLGITFLSTMWG